MLDLHTHTSYSDGTDSVEELLKNAENQKLEILSITDHDNIDSYYELEKNSELRKLFSGKIIIGAELKTYFDGVPVEVLAYGIDYKKIRIHKIDNETMQKEVLEKAKNIARELGLKFNEENVYIDIKDPTKQWAAFTLGTEILKHEENKEIIAKLGEFTPTSFFRVHQSNKESPFYIDETYASIDMNETINRIHEAGGLAFLAHGYEYPFENSNKTIEKILSTTGIDGAECIYPTFSEQQKADIMSLCKKHNKFISGGSDYHAKNKPHISLGTGINNNIKIEYDIIKEWADKIAKI